MSRTKSTHRLLTVIRSHDDNLESIIEARYLADEDLVKTILTDLKKLTLCRLGMGYFATPTQLRRMITSVNVISRNNYRLKCLVSMCRGNPSLYKLVNDLYIVHVKLTKNLTDQITHYKRDNSK